MSAPDCRHRITVIIPTWNRAQTILRAISSAIDQSLPPFEILVCDDGSTDNTETVVRGIGDPRIRWIAGEHAGCPATPRNRGIAASNGDLIAFLDSDDCWLPEKLEVQVAAMEKMGVRAVCSNAYRENGEFPSTRLISWDRETLGFADLLINNRVICSSVLVERSVLDGAEGFPEGAALRVGEDYALWLKISQLTQFAYLDVPLVAYKDDPANSVRSKGPSITTQRFRVFRHYLSWRLKRTLLGTICDSLKIGLAFGVSHCHFVFHRLLTVALEWRRFLVTRKGETETDSAVRMPPPQGSAQAHCKTNSPAVSVILPAHNAVRYLRQAIDSILFQSYHDFELIVVDDASVDGTRAILNSYADPRIVRLTLAENLGIVGALNAALMLAKGAYIARMDADDIAMPDRLQRQVRYLDTHPDIAIVGTWIRGFGDVRRPYIHRYPLSNASIQATQYFENPFAHPSVMIRRTMLARLEQGYSAEFPYVEDWELWCRLTRDGAGANIPEALIQYRIHSLSLSQNFFGFQQEGKKRLLAKIYADAGLPFRSEFLIEPPRPEVQWLHDCYTYFREIQKKAKSSTRLDPEVLEETLQQQLIHRVKQMVWPGFYPAFFVLLYRISNESLTRRLAISLRVLIITNARIFLVLRDKFR